MSLREAAQQALEALEDSHQNINPERRYADELTRQIADSITALRAALAADSRICTCHPDDNPPKPCQRKYALSECREAALAEDAMQRLTDEQQMIERGTKAWADVPDATAWVDEMRGNVPAPTGHESRQVEPVAYVKGYSKGRCIIEAVDPDWLLPVGMALYRSPPANQNYLNGYCVGRTDLLAEQAKAETVEPVAWMVYTLDGQSAFVTANPADFTPEHRALPLYTSPPKREPLTDEQICEIFISHGRDKETFARAIERAHGIGGEE